MRRSSSTTSTWAASSGNSAAEVCMIPLPQSAIASRPAAARAVGPINEAQHAIALIGIEHRDQETPYRVAISRPNFGKRMAKAGRLQRSETHSQRLALYGNVEQSLSAILGAFLLLHISFIDKLF